jgi:hypothetical protein
MAVKNASRKLTSRKINNIVGWEGAVARAEAKILSLRLRITELQKAIQVFRENAQRGEPWGEEKQDAATN